MNLGRFSPITAIFPSSSHPEGMELSGGQAKLRQEGSITLVEQNTSPHLAEKAPLHPPVERRRAGKQRPVAGASPGNASGKGKEGAYSSDRFGCPLGTVPRRPLPVTPGTKAKP